MSCEILLCAVGRPADAEISGVPLHMPRNMPEKVNVLVADIWMGFSKEKVPACLEIEAHHDLFFLENVTVHVYAFMCIYALNMPPCACINMYV